MEVILAGRSPGHLDAVERASRLLCERGIEIRSQAIGRGNYRQILEGADCVIIQIRVGGFSGRLFDESFPINFRLCGDEGLGVGGLSAGWRTWPVLMTILEAIASFCPQSFVILLTAPLTMLVRASLRHVDLNLVGICELPWTTLRQFSGLLGLQARELACDYVGFNHFGWFYNIRSRGQDLMDRLAAAKCAFPPADVLRRYRCLPTRYLRLHYEADQVLAEQTANRSRRAEVLANCQSRAYEVYESGDLGEIEAVLQNRTTPWYSDAVGPLLLALDGESLDLPFFLSVRNADYVSFLADDDVIECRHEYSNGKLVRSPLYGECPRHMIENLTQMAEFERKATNAIMGRSVQLLREALGAHPWIHDHSHLGEIAEEIVSANEAIALY